MLFYIFKYGKTLIQFKLIKQVKNKIIIKVFLKIDLTCFTCNRCGHLSRECPNTHMIFNNVKKKKLMESIEIKERENVKRR